MFEDNAGNVVITAGHYVHMTGNFFTPQLATHSEVSKETGWKDLVYCKNICKYCEMFCLLIVSSLGVGMFLVLRDRLILRPAIFS